MNRWTWLLLAAVSLGTVSCGGTQEEVHHVSETPKLSDAELDAHRVELLPEGAFAVGAVDAQAFFKSAYGNKLEALAARAFPMPPSVGFDAKRDVKRVLLGLYLGQSIAPLGIVEGTFQPAAMEKAAKAAEPTPWGDPLVATTYTGRTIYTVRNFGFCALTEHTLLFGAEEGLRRVLDRIEQRSLKNDVPLWARDLVEQKGAPIVGAAELTDASILGSLRGQLPFLQGLERVRVVGNFQEPGMNAAGTARYLTEKEAVNGKAGLEGSWLLLQGLSFLNKSFPQPLRKLDLAGKEREVTFVAELDEEELLRSLNYLDQLLPAPRPAAPRSQP